MRIQITITGFRRHLGYWAKRVSEKGDRLIITRNGKKIFAVINIKDWHFLLKTKKRREQNKKKQLHRKCYLERRNGYGLQTKNRKSSCGNV